MNESDQVGGIWRNSVAWRHGAKRAPRARFPLHTSLPVSRDRRPSLRRRIT